MAEGRERVALAAFVSCSVLAGGNAVGVRFSNRELEPLWGAALRFLAATGVLVAIMLAMRLAVPRGRALVGCLVYGVLNFAAAFALLYYALDRVHAGFGQTVLAIVPLATLLLAVAHGQERLRPDALVGTLLAVAGIAVMSGPSLGDSLPVLSLLAILGGALCFAEAAVLVHRLPDVHPVAMNAVAMGVGAAILTVAALLTGDAGGLPDRTATWVAFGYLVLIGSVVVFILYVTVLRIWAAARAADTFVIIPVVAVLASAWLDDEPIGIGLLLGGPLVLAGVYVGTLRPAHRDEARQARRSVA